MTLKKHVPSDNFNRVIHKRRRRRIVNRKYRNAFNINTLNRLSRLPLQITNDPFAYNMANVTKIVQIS
ncbi:2354_t:CDS:2 [Rhizophagus irregularis]|nr:2354_t:CDS:2 [Rhizophagus irregularis]